MCANCGCGELNNCHGDIRHITSYNLLGALDANKGSLTLREVAANLVNSLWQLIGRVGPDATEGQKHLDSL